MRGARVRDTLSATFYAAAFLHSSPHSRYVRLSLSVGLETVYNQANGYLTDVSIVGGLYCDAYGLFSIRSRIEFTQGIVYTMSIVSSTGKKYSVSDVSVSQYSKYFQFKIIGFWVGWRILPSLIISYWMFHKFMKPYSSWSDGFNKLTSYHSSFTLFFN